MTTRLMIHGATSVEMIRTSFGEFVTHDLTVTLKDGTDVIVQLFADKHLVIEQGVDRDSVEEAARLARLNEASVVPMSPYFDRC
jgi:hypothetical protein